MPDINLRLRHIDFLSDQNMPVSAWRACAETLFVTSSGAQLSFFCIVDSGAPLSVMPYSRWHGRGLQWTPLGQHLTHQGKVVTGALDWQGVLCELGETSVHLVDVQTQLQVGPFLAVAKFARHAQPQKRLETVALLGLNFLIDSRLQLLLDGKGGVLTGRLSVP